MSMFELVLQIAVVVLLGGALPFAIRLERQLRALRNDRGALEAGAAGLTEATRQAEAASIRLRAAAEMAGRQVGDKVQAAEPLRDDLRYLVERAEALADRLEGLVRHARPMAAEPAVPELAPTAGQSQAERDLLRALRMAR